MQLFPATRANSWHTLLFTQFWDTPTSGRNSPPPLPPGQTRSEQTDAKTDQHWLGGEGKFGNGVFFSALVRRSSRRCPNTFATDFSFRQNCSVNLLRHLYEGSTRQYQLPFAIGSGWRYARIFFLVIMPLCFSGFRRFVPVNVERVGHRTGGIPLLRTVSVIAREAGNRYTRGVESFVFPILVPFGFACRTPPETQSLEQHQANEELDIEVKQS